MRYVDLLCTLRLFVRNDNTLSAGQPIVDVSRQLVFTADQVRRRRVVLVQFPRRGVVRTARHHLTHVLRPHVDGHGADQAAVRRPGPRPGHRLPTRRRRTRSEPNWTRAAHSDIQLVESLRVLSTNRYRNRNCII